MLLAYGCTIKERELPLLAESVSTDCKMGMSEVAAT